LTTILAGKLARALRDADRVDNDAAILDAISEVLQREVLHGTATGVVFSTTEWDNGYFFSVHGNVLFADGYVRRIDFDSIVDEAFTEEYGCRGRDFTLAIDLRTGTMDA